MSDAKQQGPNTLSLPFVEALYADFLQDRASVPDAWRLYFDGIGEANGFAARPQLAPSFPQRRLFGKPGSPPAPPFEADGNGEPALAPRNATDRRVARTGPASTAADAAFARSAEALFRSFRARGHLIAQIDPLGAPRPALPDLKPEYFGFTEGDLDRLVEDPSAEGGTTLRQVLDRLRRTYCGSVGVQFLHIEDTGIREWLQDRMERAQNRARPSREEQLRLLGRLTEAQVFEDFIQKKYIGSKSFSVEGCETLIALLDLAIDIGASHGLSEIVLGMAHRGRLNVLANILGKPPRLIFRQFEDTDPDLYAGAGDVKYHLGYSADLTTPGGQKIHLSLCYNPSHLEYVNPVATGRLRAKQDRAKDEARRRGMVVLIHGDAAFAGEGVVQETLNMSQLAGYRVGGTLHVIVNNQIGFTTLPEEGRSTPYATDVARMLQVPIFHVNGEDPEAVAYVVRLSLEFRKQFQRDVVIDLYGYRRHGHNEGDEPAFTQPELYREIAKRRRVHELYRDELIAQGRVTLEEAEGIARQMRDRLEDELAKARNGDKKPAEEETKGVWMKYHGGADAAVPDGETGVDRARLSQVLASIATFPAEFHPNPKIKRGLELRMQQARG
ncbi:MAG: thiamine pyrophosphate-dependent enzyme, partial [Candidatus Eiseniibacteriota bacterium]